MKSLAVDTSSNICAVAVLEDEKVIDKIELNNGKTHSENFMVILSEILKRNNINLDEISFISCNVGPGSFTGIRIGISSIKSISEVKSIPLAQVNSLETLAYNVEFSSKKILNYNICSLIDARNNQVYAGIFNREYELLEELMAEDIDVVLEKIKKYENIIFIGNGAVFHKDKIFEKIANPVLVEENLNNQSSVCVGILGYKKFKNGQVVSADEINPIYLRKSRSRKNEK